jgi:hypothetical protein
MMMNLHEPPISQIIAALLRLVATCSAAASARLIARGLRLASALDLVRGIRLCVLALVATLCAVGLLSGRLGFVTMGAIILGEELYETGVLAAIICLGERQPR